jgi:hypothetical protein
MDDFVMRLGGHWVQTHGKSFILLVGNKVDFGAKELSCLWQCTIWLDGKGSIEMFRILWRSIAMRAHENAARAEKKETKAFYAKLLDEDGLEPLRKAETAVPERERIDKEAQEKRRKPESWHAFKSP